MTPPIDPNFISPTGLRVTPHPRPGTEQEAAFTALTGLTAEQLRAIAVQAAALMQAGAQSRYSIAQAIEMAEAEMAAGTAGETCPGQPSVTSVVPAPSQADP